MRKGQERTALGRQRTIRPGICRHGDAVDAFNAEPRTCGTCHTAQARFPSELMGWRRYAQYVALANRARTDMEKAW